VEPIVICRDQPEAAACLNARNFLCGFEQATSPALPRPAGDQHHDFQLVGGAAALQQSDALALLLRD
jgi:hypothetical protein